MLITETHFCEETTTTTGSIAAGNTITLGGAVSGFGTFSTRVGVGNEAIVTLRHNTAWQVFRAELTGATTLVVRQVVDSSDSGNPLTLGAGTKYVYLAMVPTYVRAAAALMGNPIINGCMEVWQRGVTFAAAADGAYSADRWQWKTTGAGVVTLMRDATVFAAGTTPLLNYALTVDVTTADAALAATDTYSLRHKIEGANWRPFARRQITVSFLVKSSKTGVHSFAIRNSGTDRYYIAEYTVNAGSTFEWKTITIPASPSTGTWNFDTGIGAELIWTLAAGSNFVGTVGSWQTGALYASTNQVNAMDSGANFFSLTAVKLELGPIATPPEFRSFNEELALCQRYYCKSFPYITAPAQGVSGGEICFPATKAGAVQNASHTIPFPVTMRTIPTLTFYSPNAASAEAHDLTSGACTGTGADAARTRDAGFVLLTTGAAGTAVGNRLVIHYAADAEL